MLPASWNFDTLYNGFRSFNNRNMGSGGQRAAKLLAIKLWEWFDPGTTRIRADWFDQGRGRVADFFMRPPTLTASNFAALWPTDLKFSAFKDLNPFSKCVKFQEATSMLRLGFVLSKWPHFDSGYLLGGPFGLHPIVPIPIYLATSGQNPNSLGQPLPMLRKLSFCVTSKVEFPIFQPLHLSLIIWLFKISAL